MGIWETPAAVLFLQSWYPHVLHFPLSTSQNSHVVAFALFPEYVVVISEEEGKEAYRISSGLEVPPN